VGEAAQEMLGEGERQLGRLCPDAGSNLQPGPSLTQTWVVGWLVPLQEEGLTAALGMLSLPAFCPASQSVFTESVHSSLQGEDSMSCPFQSAMLTAGRSQVEPGSWLVDDRGAESVVIPSISEQKHFLPHDSRGPPQSEPSELPGRFESSLSAPKFTLRAIISSGSSSGHLRSPWEEGATVIPVLLGRAGDLGARQGQVHQCWEQSSSAEGLMTSFAFVGTILGLLNQTHDQAHPYASK